MKIIVIGPSLSGKTTLARELRKTIGSPISEMDEELTNLNGGQFPLDSVKKHTILAPKITEKILNMDDILFFTNTDYFTPNDLQRAKNNGFKIIQINIGYEELIKRNDQRVKNEKYDDLSVWLKGMLSYQEDIKKRGLVDETIDGNKPIPEVINQLISLIPTAYTK